MILGGLALLHPILRFIGFHVPRKPLRVEVTQRLVPGKFFLSPQFILFATESKFWAVSRKCTHLGCTLNYNENEDILICPCHQSHFSKEGLVLHGPAQNPLKIYEVEKRESSPFFIVTM
ncbi:MAG: ubiquinol-cytochrome c reductase iron-sulfur subunit [Desulfoprunum sp.]|nr:ubiquinol-cytochrome c reductase iron-sulfur subunit [Desulfoprunum sp.]